jgi:hypothetical protein
MLEITMIAVSTAYVQPLNDPCTNADRMQKCTTLAAFSPEAGRRNVSMLQSVLVELIENCETSPCGLGETSPAFKLPDRSKCSTSLALAR